MGSVVTAVVALVLLVAGCDAGRSGPNPSPTTSGLVAESLPEPTANVAVTEFFDPLGRVFVVTSGAAEPDVVVQEDSVRVQVYLASADEVLRMSAPEGAVWGVLADSSAILRDPGAPAAQLGGINAPSAQDRGGTRVRVRLSSESDPASDQSLSFVPQFRSATSFPVRVEFEVSMLALERVEWAGDLEGGRSLQVFPTKWGRSGSQAAQAAVWESVIALEPEAESDVMDKQLRCHALGAPDKESWNLEPWRPDVPYLDYLLARCNPVS